MISLKSKITRALLNYFFINPDDSLYINEICKKLRVDKRNLVKKIGELEQEGILKSQPKGNLKLCSINKAHPLYEEYRNIILKTIGFENVLRKVVKEVEGIKKMYIYGSYAKNAMDAYSDIDLLAIGKHSIISFQKKINKLQKEINREINVVNMGERDFEKRIKEKDPFVCGMLKHKYIKII